MNQLILHDFTSDGRKVAPHKRGTPGYCVNAWMRDASLLMLYCVNIMRLCFFICYNDVLIMVGTT